MYWSSTSLGVLKSIDAARPQSKKRRAADVAARY